MSKNCSDFWRKTFIKFVKTTFFVSRGMFRWFFCGKTKLRSNIFEFYRQKTIQLLTETFCQACQKCNLGAQWNVLRNFFPGKKLIFFWFSEIERKNFRLWAKRIRQVCQKFNLAVQGNVLRKNNRFEKIFTSSSWSFLDIQATSVELWRKKNQLACSNCVLRVQEQKLIFLEK